MGISFKYKSASTTPRMSYRIKYSDMRVAIEPTHTICNVDNFSLAGIAFMKPLSTEYKKGEIIQFALVVHNRIYIPHLKAEIVRVDNAQNIICCSFRELLPIQEKKLDRFILQLQKYEILVKKKEEAQKEGKLDFEAVNIRDEIDKLLRQEG